MFNHDLSIEERSSLIEQAFKAMPSYAGNQRYDGGIASAAQSLANMRDLPMAFPNALKRAGKSTVDKELQQFAKLLKEANQIFHNFHETTINKLADKHVMRSQIEHAINPLLEVAEIALKIDLSDLPRSLPRGRSEQYATAVTSMIYYNYQLIFGKRPPFTTRLLDNKASGEFVSLVERIFVILSIKASAASQAHSVVRQQRKRGASKKS